MQFTCRANTNLLYINNESVHAVFTGILLIICVLFNDNVIVDYLALVCFLQYYIISLMCHPDIIWKYILLHYSIATAAVGGFLCDTLELYLYELETTTFFCGSVPVITFYYWLFIVFVLFFDKKIGKAIYAKDPNIRFIGGDVFRSIIVTYICPIIFFMGLIMFSMVASKPSFFLGADRFSYVNYMNPFLARIQMLPCMLSPLVLVSLLKQKKYSMKKKLSIFFFTYVPYLLFAIWIGQRFQVFLLLTQSLVPLFVTMSNVSFVNNTIKIFLFCAFLLSFVWLFTYLRNDSFMDLLIERLCQQGQLWWKIYAQEKEINFPWRLDECYIEFLSIIQSVFDYGKSHNYGIYNLMYLTTPENRVSIKLLSGSRYAAQGVELAFYYLKYGGLFIMPCIGAIMFSFLSNNYVHAVYQGRILSSFVYLRLLQKSFTAYCQGDWHALLSPACLVCYVLLALFCILRHGEKIHQIDDNERSYI